jgi:hypothetical protein
MSSSSIIRQFGDDTSVTDPANAEYVLDLVNQIPQYVYMAAALNGSSQMSIKLNWTFPGSGVGLTVSVRTFGAIFKRGITP